MTRPFDAFCAAARAWRGTLFQPDAPIVAASAPGWLDLIGGSAAYGGSLALGWPTNAVSYVALQPDPAPILTLHLADQQVRLPTTALQDASGWPISYAELAPLLAAHDPYFATLLSVWVALMREEFVRFPAGAQLWMQPATGPGARTSWATACAQALVTAYAVKLSPRELALTVAVACAQHDPHSTALGPMVSVCAPASHVLLLHQQPAWHWGDIHLPHGTTIWALSVGDPTPQPPHLAAHALAAYQQALRTAPATADEQWLGYLANIPSSTLSQYHRGARPTTLRGSTTPEQSAIMAQEEAAHILTAFAIDDHLRARTISALLRAAASKPQRDDDFRLIGELLQRSHWEQHAIGYQNAHADALLAQITTVGPDHGLFGARFPAPACGATLVVLGRTDAEALLQSIATDYATQIGQPVHVTSGTAPGASPAGARHL
jgi:L-arabinokinase